MWLNDWPAVKLSGSSQAIPRSCPGCLKSPTVEWRYAYRRPFPLWVLDRTSYFQTFYYCEECAGGLRTFFKYRRWKGVLTFLAFPSLFIAEVAAATTFGKAGPLHAVGETLGVAVLLGGTALLVLGGFGAIAQFLKKKIRGPAGQGSSPLWGPTAYYVGDGMMGFAISSAHVYRAYRPDWIKALVQSNPTQVDEASYQRFVGAPKPVPTDAKPFAP
jgi:hypothetical protein